ncbi:MAG: RsmD family RNA methyltransferase [Ignavibacteria bacterium]|nr:RsmD family RNA methyltransferase [Ignavibacteria bacterium]
MRIISGAFKKRRILSPNRYSKIRPSTDYTRETVFNILSNFIHFEDFKCIDLFCGTGSYGLECLSRGAQFCYFIDIDTKLVTQNISSLNLKDLTTVKKSDALKFLKTFKNYADRFLIFADPPYIYKSYDKLIETISVFNCIFILEHTDNFNSKNFVIKPMQQKKIGKTNVSIYNFLKENKNYE